MSSKTDAKMQKRFDRLSEKRNKNILMHETAHIMQQINHGGFSNVEDISDLTQRIEPPQAWTKGIELCNRTACQTARNVVYWNHSTRAYYCPSCAHAINSGAGTQYDKFGNAVPLCSIDDNKMKYEKEFKQKNPEVSYQSYKDDIEPAFIF